MSLLAILQLPFLRLMPSEESAVTLLAQYSDVVTSQQHSVDTIYSDMLVWWVLPISNIILFAISSLLCFKRSSAFIIPFSIAIIAYIALYDYMLILEAPSNLYNLLNLPAPDSIAYEVGYDIIINYMILPFAYIAIPLLYISSNNSSKLTGTDNVPPS